MWGNLTVALLSGLAFVYGGLAVGRIEQAIVVGIFAFFYHWAREIIKDVEDIEGDRSQRIRTLPICYGVKTALVWATCIIAVLMGLTLVPYLIHLFGFAYLVVVSIGVNLFLLYVVISMWKNQESKNLGRLAVLMKADMLVGLLAVYLGSV
jgi:geranylgeranylglycerol-phosphate geranylgeranyltransferase